MPPEQCCWISAQIWKHMSSSVLITHNKETELETWNMNVDSQFLECGYRFTKSLEMENSNQVKETQEAKDMKWIKSLTWGKIFFSIPNNPSILQHQPSHKLSVITRKFQVRFLKAFISGKYLWIQSSDQGNIRQDNFIACSLEHIYFINETADNLSHREVLRSHIYPNLMHCQKELRIVERSSELGDRYVLGMKYNPELKDMWKRPSPKGKQERLRNTLRYPVISLIIMDLNRWILNIKMLLLTHGQKCLNGDYLSPKRTSFSVP